MEAAVTSNTVMVVGSAPAYPHGVVDPIAELVDSREQLTVLDLGGFAKGHAVDNCIALLREQTNPNPQVLQIYAQMLESRQAVLGWLNQSEMQKALDKLG